MMNDNKQATRRRLVRATYTLATLMLLLVCGAAREAQAQWTTSGSNVTTTNNVGIGTTTPATPLQVEGASTDANNYVQAYFKNTNAALPYGGIGVDGQNQSHLRFFLGGALKWQWRVGAGNATDDLRAYSWTLGNDVFTLKNNGYVGIGTTSPATLLELKSAANSHNALTLNTTTAGYADTLNFQEADTIRASIQHNPSVLGGALLFNTNGGASPANTKMVIDAAGNVGIGTTNPANPFDLRSTASRVARFTSTGAVHMGVQIDTLPGYNSNLVLMNGGVEQWYLGNRAGDNHFSIYEATGTQENFVLTQSGNVGLGTATPTAKLDVRGNINVSGNINAKYQDVAEWVDSTEQLAAGTVVVINVARTNQVMASRRAYDTRVAGVVSAQPGLALGEAGAGKVLVATTGRVKLKVDATRGPIRVGDLLVTSDKEGVAMKSEPLDLGGVPIHRPGTLIGKALEPLAQGVGEILVLLSLQ
jgi:hypothetical protein